jgi:hypothetical protein
MRSIYVKASGSTPTKYPAQITIFCLSPKFSLDAVVLGICKLFDLTTRRYEKDTIPVLMDYAKTHFTDTYVTRLDKDILLSLGVDDTEATNIVTDFHTRSAFPHTRDVLFNVIDDLMPTCKTNATLEQLFRFRDKAVAHQERVGCALTTQLKYLPCVDAMEKINDWAINFCQLLVCTMTNEALLPHAVSARMSALHVVAKVLDKNFDIVTDAESYQEREAFFRTPAAWVK